MFVFIALFTNLRARVPPPSHNMGSTHPYPNDYIATSQTGNKSSMRIIRASEMYGTLIATRTRTQNFSLTLQQALTELKTFEKFQQQLIPDRTDETKVATGTKYK